MEYFISDTHFFHDNVIRFDARPFSTVEEMNKKLVENWNAAVSASDHVYILGDFCWKTAQDQEYLELVCSLRGHKHLVKGNHDPDKWTTIYAPMFDSISDYKELKVRGKHLILSHYPMPFYKADYNDNCWMLYGHVHITKEYQQMVSLTRELARKQHQPGENRGQLVNVGCMLPYMNYTPQPLENLINAWKELVA